MSDLMNSTRRARLLTQMGITQFELRRPAALKGEVAISLPAQLKLIVIVRQQPDANDKLLCDIVRSCGLDMKEIYFITPQQAVMLPKNASDYALWILGETALPNTLNDSALQLTSPTLAELAASPAAKRALWQQICQHEHYFTS